MSITTELKFNYSFSELSNKHDIYLFFQRYWNVKMRETSLSISKYKQTAKNTTKQENKQVK